MWGNLSIWMGSRPSKRSLGTVQVSMDIMGVVFCPFSCAALCCRVRFGASASFPYLIASGLTIIPHICSITFATDDVTLHYEVYFYSMFYVAVSPSHDLLIAMFH
jgi:hypothetical protein